MRINKINKAKVFYILIFCIIINVKGNNAIDNYIDTQSIGLQANDTGNILISSQISGSLDFYNILGEGQVNYENIEIINKNSYPIKVYIDSIEIIHSGGIRLNSGIFERIHDTKEAYIYLTNMASSENIPIINKKYNLECGVIQPDENMIFKVQGELNELCTSWNSDDYLSFKVNFLFDRADINNESKEISLDPLLEVIIDKDIGEQLDLEETPEVGPEEVQCEQLEEIIKAEQVVEEGEAEDEQVDPPLIENGIISEEVEEIPEDKVSKEEKMEKEEVIEDVNSGQDIMNRNEMNSDSE